MNKEIVGKKIKVNDFNMEFGRQAKFVNLICFYKYQKDNNLYAIYCDDTNIPYGIINFGTAHIKGNSLIVIGSKDPDQEMIKEFTYKLSNNETLDNFEIQDITNINAIELVSPNKLEIKKEILASIVEKVIPKPKKVEKSVKNSSKKKKNTLLPLLLVLIFICIIVYFFFFKTNEEKDNTTKMIVCTRETKSKDIAANVIEDNTYNFKQNTNIFFAGQITGVEGYVESISSGMVASLNAVSRLKDTEKVIFSEFTMIGSLAKYISTNNEKFQPMNANFGILPELEGKKIKDKKERYTKLAERSLNFFED